MQILTALSRCSLDVWLINILWSSDAMWRHRPQSTSLQVMVCCLTTPSHYPNQMLTSSSIASCVIHRKAIVINSKCSGTLQWRHNERDGVSNHQPHDCLLNRLFRRRSREASKLRATGLCEGNSPGTGEFPAQRASNAENVSIWWRHHESILYSVPSPLDNELIKETVLIFGHNQICTLGTNMTWWFRHDAGQ